MFIANIVLAAALAQQPVTQACESFSVSAFNSGPVCRNAPITLSASASAPANYTWQPPGQSAELHGQSVTFQLRTAGEYRVTAVDANGCVATAVTNVEFFQPELTEEPAPMCRYETRELTLATPLENIVWDVGNGTIVSGQGTQTVTVQPSAGTAPTVEVYVSGTDPVRGCTFDSMRVESIDVLHSLATPILTAPAATCASASMMAVAPLDEQATYAWSIVNGTIDSTSSPIPWAANFTADGSGDVQLGVTMSWANGCSVTDVRTISVDGPTAAIETPTIDACSNEIIGIPVVFTGTPPFTINWSDGPQTITTEMTYTRPFQTESDTTLTITSVSDAHCSGTATGAVEIHVAEATSIVEQPEGGRVRTGERFTLSVQSENATSYQWFEGESGDVRFPIANATGATHITRPMVETTKFWVRVTGDCGFEDSITATVEVTPRKRRAVRR